MPPPAGVDPEAEPPPSTAEREREWTADHDPQSRDIRPSIGSPGAPASWRRAAPDAHVAIARPGWGDAQWSYLFKEDTRYAGAELAPGELAEANRRGRWAPMPATVQGPFIKGPVWTWEVPLYFWVGGIAAGSAFVAVAADLAGDARSAVLARRVALGAVLPAPVLLIADLGRPARFLNMLRIFKPRSPMNTGAWCLAAFSATATGAVGADLTGARRAAALLGGATAALGGYLGSYTGVLLAATAVPLWARSRTFLPPIFVATATATGAAACRLTLEACGLPREHPTRTALARLEAGAIAVELALSTANEHRLGRAGDVLSAGRAGAWFRSAKGLVLAGLALQLVRGRLGERAQDLASACYLAGGLCFRYAWVDAGRASAADDEAVARMARGRVTAEDELRRPGARRTISRVRGPERPRPAALLRRWSTTTGRLSLLVEERLRAARRTVS
jgi:formate-dependent nitrite reductase membrane component NrfD